MHPSRHQLLLPSWRPRRDQQLARRKAGVKQRVRNVATHEARADEARAQEEARTQQEGCAQAPGTLECTGLAACRGYPFLDSYRVIRVSLNTPQLVLGRRFSVKYTWCV